MHLVRGWNEVLPDVLSDSLVRLKGWKDVNESEEVHLKVGLAHRPLHEEAVEVAGVEKGGVCISEVGKDLSAEVYDGGVERWIERHSAYQ